MTLGMDWPENDERTAVQWFLKPGKEKEKKKIGIRRGIRGCALPVIASLIYFALCLYAFCAEVTSCEGSYESFWGKTKRSDKQTKTPHSHSNPAAFAILGFPRIPKCIHRLKREVCKQAPQKNKIKRKINPIRISGCRILFPFWGLIRHLWFASREPFF